MSQSPPDLDQLQIPNNEQLEPLPAWEPLPDPPPGRQNPDPLPPGAVDLGDGYAIQGPGPSTPASTPRPTSGTVAKVSADGIGEAMTSLVKGLGEGLHHLTTEENDDSDLWLVGNQEAKAIGQPLGRIIARRVPDLPAGAGADLADGISAAIPAALYLVRNLAAWIPRMRRKNRKPGGAVRAPADLAAQPA